MMSALFTQIAYMLTPSSFPSRESSVEPDAEEATPKGRVRHKSEPASIRPKDIDRRLTTGLSALLQEGEISQNQSQGGFQQHVLNHFDALVSEFSARKKKLTHFKTLTEIDSFQDLSHFDSFQDPYHIQYATQKLTPLKTLGTVIYVAEIDSFQDPNQLLHRSFKEGKETSIYS